MKQKTKSEITAAFILFFFLMALLCIETLLSGTGFWYYLYFGVVIAISIPLGLFTGHLLSLLVLWNLSEESKQTTARIITEIRKRLTGVIKATAK